MFIKLLTGSTILLGFLLPTIPAYSQNLCVSPFSCPSIKLPDINLPGSNPSININSPQNPNIDSQHSLPFSQLTPYQYHQVYTCWWRDQSGYYQVYDVNMHKSLITTPDVVNLTKPCN